MSNQTGRIVRSRKILSNGQVITIEGTVCGRVRSFGGMKWLLKDVRIVEPLIIGVRKLK